ncbi:transcriptional regulator family protein [Nocardioides baekrokdamisoli]|uniref:Transcriptional regulator family protein n=1 Tax=Nocardioides baekrokdamisoli TaxID=1804624 RepID=A0A3G9J406_9ACTN|nr:helix-turn-helix domain-containing protein [Nocardioides baekrokdamisoli]BBH17749.1 transcriptional regulator family protein [Nocardioides baekrokdamisoli]
MTNPTGVATFEERLADRSRWRTGEDCPIVKALDIVGTRSALLILREAFYGTTRFDDFVARIEITEAVAAARLRELTQAGLFERVPYKEPGQRTRYEYQLTQMGRDFAPAMVGLYQWGGAHLSPGGSAPLQLTHEPCGSEVTATLVCETGEPVTIDEIRIKASAAALRAGRR